MVRDQIRRVPSQASGSTSIPGSKAHPSNVTPSPGRPPQEAPRSHCVHTWGQGWRGLAHLTQRVAKIPHQQGHVLVPRAELGALAATGKGVPVDALHPVYHGLGHGIQGSLLGELRVDHGGDFLGRRGAKAGEEKGGGAQDCHPQLQNLIRTLRGISQAGEGSLQQSSL